MTGRTRELLIALGLMTVAAIVLFALAFWLEP
jgi:hypothetical protein